MGEIGRSVVVDRYLGWIFRYPDASLSVARTRNSSDSPGDEMTVLLLLRAEGYRHCEVAVHESQMPPNERGVVSSGLERCTRANPTLGSDHVSAPDHGYRN